MNRLAIFILTVSSFFFVVGCNSEPTSEPATEASMEPDTAASQTPATPAQGSGTSN